MPPPATEETTDTDRPRLSSEAGPISRAYTRTRS